MRRIVKIAAIAALSLLGLFVVICGIAAGARAYLQHRNAEALAIRTPNGITEAVYVPIGGIRQWVQIRGENRKNAVILCLNGGPGASWIPLTSMFRSWEGRYTIVLWDQRGEGKTLEATGSSIASTMSIARMTQDGIEVAEFLRAHLHKQKMILLGHSWGSILGIHMIKQRPDLFSAYVGTGQVADMGRNLQLTYAATLRQARAANDARAITDLEAIGPPPYGTDGAKIGKLFDLLAKFGPPSDAAAMRSAMRRVLTAPGYTLRDIQYRNQGFFAVPTPQLYAEMLSTNLPRLGYEFKLPIYMIEGEDDNITLTPLARAYFERVRSPKKAFIVLAGLGHFALWSDPDAFLRALVGATASVPPNSRHTFSTRSPTEQRARRESHPRR